MSKQLPEDQGFTARQQQDLLNLIEPFFTAINTTLNDFQKTQASQQQTLSEHTGTLAEILVNVKKLDQERFVAHHRITEVVEKVKQLKPRVTKLERRILVQS